MTTDDGPVWVGDGTYMGGYAVWMGDEGVAKFYRGRKMREAGFNDEQRRPASPELRLEDLDRDGVSAEVIYGIRFVEDAIKDPLVVDATYRAYNDFITEFCEADPERLIGIGVIPAHSPEAAAEELAQDGRRWAGAERRVVRLVQRSRAGLALDVGADVGGGRGGRGRDLVSYRLWSGHHHGRPQGPSFIR